MLVAKGSDSSSDTVGTSSKPIEITVGEGSLSQDISLTAAANTQHLDAAGKVGFTLTLTNRTAGDTFTNLVVSEKNLGEVGKVETLDAEEQKLTVEYDVNANTTFEFIVQAEDEDGNAVAAQAAPLLISVGPQGSGGSLAASSNNVGDTTGTLTIIFGILVVLLVVTAVVLLIFVIRERVYRKRHR
ncbi:hypothetical protein SDC9_194983 [bioreactor metagenome]|uniref:CARDB domain-containing protein n=1 Tax=bioreactor metagenome TaxID=1076179 RepID=A0A645I7T1_9ZZZZ